MRGPCGEQHRAAGHVLVMTLIVGSVLLCWAVLLPSLCELWVGRAPMLHVVNASKLRRLLKQKQSAVNSQHERLGACCCLC